MVVIVVVLGFVDIHPFGFVLFPYYCVILVVDSCLRVFLPLILLLLDVPEALLNAPVQQGEAQSPKCQDVMCGLLFWIHVGVVLYFCVTSWKLIDSSDFTIDDDDYEYNTTNVVQWVVSVTLPFVYISLATGGTALLLSIGGMSIASGDFCESIIKFALIVSPALLTLAAMFVGIFRGDLYLC